MKKIKVVFLMCILVFSSVCAGCSSESADVSSLTAHESWYFYNETIGENEVMSFGDDYSFSYHCECGEPVGDSDIYESFAYDAVSMTIHLSNGYDDSTKEISVLSHNNYHLMVEIDGRVKTFTPVSINGSEAYYGENNEYISGYEGYCTVFDLSDGNAQVGPFNYDGDVEYPEGTIELIDMAEGIQFYELIVNTDVAPDGLAQHDISYKELTLSQVEKRLEDTSGSAFMWYNDSLEIEKMMFWGQTVVYN